MDEKLLNIAYKITSEGITTDILNEIAEFFEVDACSVVLSKDLDLTYVKGSSYFEIHGIDIKDIYKKTKDENITIKKALTEGLYVTNDYQKDKNANKVFKKLNLKSLCLLKIDAEFNAIIGLESFEKERVFLREDVEKLKFIAVFIAKALESIIFKDFLNNKIPILDINRIEFDDKESIRKWLIKHLSNILTTTHSKALSFVFPKYNIYAFLSDNKKDNFITFKKTSKIHNMLTYRMYSANIMGPCVFQYELSKNFLSCIETAKQELDINNILIIPIIENGELLSVIGYGYVYEHQLSKYDITLTTMMAKKLTNYIASTKEFTRLKDTITKSEEDIINSFILAIELRDTYTKGHSQRVAFYAKKIAESLKIKDNLIKQIHVAGLLHDIGKISIPDNILMKSSKLTEIEYEMIKYHAILSYELVNQFRSLEDLKSIAKIVRQHHEKCDGSGYPDGLKCKDITLGARILAVADVFDALTTARPYREAFLPQDAIQIMKSEVEHFDNNIFNNSIDILLNNFEDAIIIGQSSIIPKAFDEYKRKFEDLDRLTGLLSRKALMGNIDKMLKLNAAFKLYLIDIKNMDLINIKYGNNFGDKLLIKTKEALLGLKEFGMVSLARFGGDSFMFIAPYAHEESKNIEKIDMFLSNLAKFVKFKFKNEKMFPDNLEFTIVKTDYTEGSSANELIFISRRYKKAISYDS